MILYNYGKWTRYSLVPGKVFPGMPRRGQSVIIRPLYIPGHLTGDEIRIETNVYYPSYYISDVRWYTHGMYEPVP